MKGLMVLPLMFVMTGIVVGQQNDSNQFGTSASTADSQNTQNFAPSEDNKVKPFGLSVSDDNILGLRTPGNELRSEIAPKDLVTGQVLSPEVVSEITLVHARNLGDKTLLVRSIRGEKDTGNGIIRFGLTDDDLASLASRKLTYQFAPSERGLFDKVAFYYVGPTTRNTSETGLSGQSATTFTPTPDERLGAPSKFPRTQFGDNDSNDSLMPMPGPAPGDANFMGPVAPIRNRIAQNNQPPAWNPEPSPQFNPNVNLQRDRLSGFPTQDTGTGGAAPVDWREIKRREHEQEVLRRRDEEDQLAFAKQQDDLRRAAQLREIRRQETQQRDLEARLAPIRTDNDWRENWQTRNQPTQNQSLADANNPFAQLSVDQQEALLEMLDDLKQVDEKTADLTERERQLALREYAVKQAEFERVMLDQYRTNSPRDIAPSRSDVGPVAGVQYQNSYRPELDRFASTDSNMGSQLQPPPKRSNTANGSTIRDFQAGIPGTENITDVNSNNGSGVNRTVDARTGKAEGVIYFLLLCSLGLNVYLALISRTFYVRYNELADELRETFTATM